MSARRALIALLATALLAGCGGSDPAVVFNPGDQTMLLTSSAFTNENRIPTKYTCDGEDVSPPLKLMLIPEGAVSLALVVDDPDAPGGTWDHWIAYDIPVTDTIPEGVGQLGTPGRSSGGGLAYEGPCPPSGSHRYYFTAYALDTRLGLAAGASKTALRDAMEGHVLATATLLGRYSRS